jgi:hypothetical protein
VRTWEKFARRTICFCKAHPVVNSTLLFLLVLIISKAMPLGRQRDHTAGKVERRSMRWAIIGAEMAKRRANIDSAFASTSAICAVMTLYTKAKENRDNHIRRSKRLSISDFSFNFNGLSESYSLSLFRFRKGDVLKKDDSNCMAGTQMR